MQNAVAPDGRLLRWPWARLRALAQSERATPVGGWVARLLGLPFFLFQRIVQEACPDGQKMTVHIVKGKKERNSFHNYRHSDFFDGGYDVSW